MNGKEMVLSILFVTVLFFGSMGLSAVLCVFHYECLISAPSVNMQDKLLKGDDHLEVSNVSLQDAEIGCIKKIKFDIKQHFKSCGESIMYQQINEYLSSCDVKMVENTLREHLE